MINLLKELMLYFKVCKKIWLISLIFMMIVLGGLLVLTEGSAIAPFIYTTF